MYSWWDNLALDGATAANSHANLVAVTLTQAIECRTTGAISITCDRKDMGLETGLE